MRTDRLAVSCHTGDNESSFLPRHAGQSCSAVGPPLVLEARVLGAGSPMEEGFYSEEKTKVVGDVWETELIQCTAVLAILH